MILAPAVRVGNLLFVSGAAGLDRTTGKLVGPDLESQARQTMENLGRVLKAAGASWSNVVKVTCWLVQPIEGFATWNKVFKEYFPTNPPARSTVGSGIVVKDALIEVELIAEL